MTKVSSNLITQSIDVHLVPFQRKLPGLADEVALRIQFTEPEPRRHLPLGGRALVQHHDPRAPFRVPEQPDGGLESLIPFRQRADLRIALRQASSVLPTRSEDETISQVDPAGPDADEDYRPEDERKAAHGLKVSRSGCRISPTGPVDLMFIPLAMVPQAGGWRCSRDASPASPCPGRRGFAAPRRLDRVISGSAQPYRRDDLGWSWAASSALVLSHR